MPAEGRATHAESLLRKVDERKAAAEVDRKRATEAAARLEQQVWRWSDAEDGGSLQISWGFVSQWL